MKTCPACGSWIPNRAEVRGGPSYDVRGWELGGINWLEVIMGAAVGACLQIYLTRRYGR